jgi:hypothetical protein
MGLSPRLDRYKDLVDASLINQIYELARSLAGLRVLLVLSCRYGSP